MYSDSLIRSSVVDFVFSYSHDDSATSLFSPTDVEEIIASDQIQDGYFIKLWVIFVYVPCDAHRLQLCPITFDSPKPTIMSHKYGVRELPQTR